MGWEKNEKSQEEEAGPREDDRGMIINRRACYIAESS